MKIAFVGDSYCDIGGWTPINDHESTMRDSWVVLIAKKLNAEILLSGEGGDCLLHSYLHYTSLLSTATSIMNEADYTIFCITEPTRLANYKLWPMSHGSLAKYFCLNHLPDKDNHSLTKGQRFIPVKKREKIMQAGLDYFKHIFLDEAHEMIQMGTLRSLDEIMVHNKKKCIWFPCFANSFTQTDTHNESMGTSRSDPWMPKSGPVSNRPLADISMSELPSNLTAKEKESWPWPPNISDYNPTVIMKQDNRDVQNLCDTRTSHMSAKHNMTLAEIVINIIRNDSFSPQLIRLEDYFSFGDTTK